MLDHEKLDVYRVSIEFASWAYRLGGHLNGVDRSARDQLVRASQSIPLNIAEGNGMLPSAERRRYLRIALGSALECAATLDVLRGCDVLGSEDVEVGKEMLVRITAMLTRMTASAREVREGVDFICPYSCEGQ